MKKILFIFLFASILSFAQKTKKQTPDTVCFTKQQAADISFVLDSLWMADDINNELIAKYKIAIKKQDSLITLDSLELAKLDSIIIYLKGIVSNLEKIASEIILLSTEFSHESSGKMAGRFRALARPDIAIEISSNELLEHPYSFVALTIRASAYADLQKIDEAIIDIDRGLKLSYDEGRLIAATAAARIYQDRHEKTGDLDDSDLALGFVQEVISKEKSKDKLEFIANIYMKIAVSRRDDDLIDHANALLGKVKQKKNVADKQIVEIAKNISQVTRPISESLVEMEENIRLDYSVNAVLIQNGFFYESYMESAEFLNQYMGFATAQGLHGKLMTGVPAGGLENCIEKLESQGKKIVVVEQVGKSKSRMIREIRYVTGSLILNRSNLILEYKP